ILEAALGTLENPPRARTLPSIVVLNGYDPTEFANHARFAHPRPYVLGVGRLAPEKGFDVLVEAFARLERTDHRPAPGRWWLGAYSPREPTPAPAARELSPSDGSCALGFAYPR